MDGRINKLYSPGWLMNRIWQWLCLISLCISVPSMAAEAPAEDSMALRGVFADAYGTQYRDHLSTVRLAGQLAEYDVQNCFLQVCVMGEGYYKSKMLARPAGLPVGYDDPLNDLLATLKDRPDNQVRIHAWITPLQAHNSRAIVPPAPQHVVAQHPDWLTKDVEGNTADSNGWIFLDAGHPQVQEYVLGIVRELVGQYDIEGILLDGLHYPEQGSRFGYNEVALQRYREETGAKGMPDPLDPAWLEWRRTQLTKLLARITQEVKKNKPEMVISVTALASGPAPKTGQGFRFSQPFSAYLQDWLTWADLNMADWIILQNFADEQTEANRFDEWSRFAVANKGQSKMWVAVAGYRNWAIDAFRQIQRARMDLADAVAIYNFRQPVRDIATAPDFFAAVQSVTLLPPRELETSAQPSLQERLERMTQALERSQIVATAETEIAPGVMPTIPQAATQPDTQPAEEDMAPVRPPYLAPWDRIYLTNRTMFEGHKIGDIGGESIFETSQGLVIKINNQYIDRITGNR